MTFMNQHIIHSWTLQTYVTQSKDLDKSADAFYSAFTIDMVTKQIYRNAFMDLFIEQNSDSEGNSSYSSAECKVYRMKQKNPKGQTKIKADGLMAKYEAFSRKIRLNWDRVSDSTESPDHNIHHIKRLFAPESQHMDLFRSYLV